MLATGDDEMNAVVARRVGRRRPWTGLLAVLAVAVLLLLAVRPAMAGTVPVTAALIAPSDATATDPAVQPTPEEIDPGSGAAAEEPVDRWDPAWLVWLTVVAAGLVALAVVWWLFLVVRVQDLLRDEGRVR